MDAKLLNSMFKSQLHSRQIHYDLYIMENGSACVIIKIRSTQLTVQLPYMIENHKNSIIVSSPQKVWKLPTSDVNRGVQLIVKDMRKNEVKFNRFGN